ncbi:pilus assembly protein [Sodalis endosymbiont of Spalangia cameroni]|uniref:pilus assembly protein n=1 Tax=Sodalis praecaptivus TaxID=1239307 RepID=UPI0031F967BF
MRLRQFISTRRGVATIEFSLTALLFFTLMLFFAEMMSITYISAAMDLAISEAAKKAKNSSPAANTPYAEVFANTLSQRQGLLERFMPASDITVEAHYCNSIAELKTACLSKQAEHNRIARYKFNYHYRPLFFPYPTSWANKITTREVIFVQESQNMPTYH